MKNSQRGRTPCRATACGPERTALGFGALLLLAAPAIAAPPPDADRSLAPWFESLTRPDTGTSCCSASDCRPVPSIIENDHWLAFIGTNIFGKDAPDRWVPVPDEKILRARDNPTGSAIACWTPSASILCFVKGPET